MLGLWLRRLFWTYLWATHTFSWKVTFINFYFKIKRPRKGLGYINCECDYKISSNNSYSGLHLLKPKWKEGACAFRLLIFLFPLKFYFFSLYPRKWTNLRNNRQPFVKRHLLLMWGDLADTSTILILKIIIWVFFFNWSRIDLHYLLVSGVHHSDLIFLCIMKLSPQ